MAPADFSSFFAASAGVAGALIGLLFVAISIAPEAEDDARIIETDIRAALALSALINALLVSLFALVPGIDLGQAITIVSLTAIASCVGVLLLIFTEGTQKRLFQVILVLGQGTIFVWELMVGLRFMSDHNLNDASNRPHFTDLATITIVLFAIGIARAWHLIGRRDTGLLHSVHRILSARFANKPPVDPELPTTP